ncbi:hypothetical protein ACG2F4_13230 [Halalkalibaculum sp. DA3122]|uniref:hypothetical protein n=1 Tax=Halalkalibaculum sp. DA3122 TaxID=3373607 RepID=UPI003754D488
MKQDIAYFKFLNLPEPIKKANNIRSKKRLDCIQYSGDYKGLDCLKNNKGMLFFYKTPAREFVNADSQRVAEWSLTKSSLNVTSLFIEDLDYPELAYGYPNSSRLLNNGDKNPFYPYRNDGYLFIMNKDITELEMLVIPDSRNLIRSFYQLLIDGELDSNINQLRQQAQAFYDYGL